MLLFISLENFEYHKEEMFERPMHLKLNENDSGKMQVFGYFNNHLHGEPEEYAKLKIVSSQSKGINVIFKSGEKEIEIIKLDEESNKQYYYRLEREEGLYIKIALFAIDYAYQVYLKYPEGNGEKNLTAQINIMKIKKEVSLEAYIYSLMYGIWSALDYFPPFPIYFTLKKEGNELIPNLSLTDINFVPQYVKLDSNKGMGNMQAIRKDNFKWVLKI